MLRRMGFFLWIIGVLALPIAHAQTANTARGSSGLVTQAIDERNLVPLRGNTRPEATPQNDRGIVADALPMEHLLLELRRPPEQERALEEFNNQLSDPASPNFHRWLAPDQFGQDFGVTRQDLDAITRWLQSHGFAVNAIYPNRMVIDFSGTAGAVRQTFHTEIHNIEVRGERHIANMSDPQIPAALAPAILGIVSLHDFKPHPQHQMHKTSRDFTSSGGATLSHVAAGTTN